MTPGTLQPRRLAVVRGTVLDSAGQPLPGVQLTVLDHPELGQTLSRSDGQFDLAVNGGGTLTVRYAKDGFLPVQRTTQTPWQDFVMLSDVVMLQLDPAVTTLSLGASAPQLARGTQVSDATADPAVADFTNFDLPLEAEAKIAGQVCGGMLF